MGLRQWRCTLKFPGCGAVDVEGSSPSSTKRDCLAGGEAVSVVCAVSTAAAEVEGCGESGSTTLQQPDLELGLGLPDNRKRCEISSNPRILHYYGLHVQVTQKKTNRTINIKIMLLTLWWQRHITAAYVTYCFLCWRIPQIQRHWLPNHLMTCNYSWVTETTSVKWQRDVLTFDFSLCSKTLWQDLRYRIIKEL